MRVNDLYTLILAAGITALLPAARVLAADQLDAAVVSGASSQPASQPCCDYDPIREFAARIGYWGSSVRGSQTIIGEYQDLDASPFWDADGLMSNGCRTLDFSATGTDEQTSVGRLHYYGGPSFEADVDYERFLHRMEGKSYAGFVAIPNATVNNPSSADRSNDNYYSRDDLNPGQDYAIRVQEYKAKFKGELAKDLKWHLKVWGMEKEGERQANAMTHCFDATHAYAGYTGTTATSTGNPKPATRQCHVLTQAQHIDWRTNEIEPGLELCLGPLNVEYSHTLRTFEQNDSWAQNVYRISADPNDAPCGFPQYPGAPPFASTAGYNIVPENMTNIDRLRLHAQLGEDTNFYGFGFVGDTKNELRDTHRSFNGGDIRLTNNSIDKVTVTARAKIYKEHTQTPTTALNVLIPDLQAFYQEAPTSPTDPAPPFVDVPVDRETRAVGVDGRWQPFQDDCDRVRRGLAFISGYEYSTLRRENVDYDLDFQLSNGVPVVFPQPNSNRNTVFVGVEEKWSPCLLTSARYKFINTEYPLYGISPQVFGPTAGTPPGPTMQSVDDAINTGQPRLENRLELCSTWNPTDNFMFTGTFFVENAVNHGPYAFFDSTSYPYMLSTWYAPTQKWSFNGGYANFTNWIDQDVTLTNAVSGTPVSPTTALWNYKARADVFNVGSAYCLTECIRLTGDFEYVRGLNAINNVGQVSTGTVPFQNPPAPYQSLGSYSQVNNETYRVSAGVDYRWRPRATTYFRYNLYDFGDIANGLTSGTSHLFLAGMTATY